MSEETTPSTEPLTGTFTRSEPPVPFVTKVCPVCFWSNKDMEEGVAPDVLRQVLNYDPHPEIAAQWAQGVVMLEVSQYPYASNQPPIPNNKPLLFPSGRWIVVPPEFVDGMFAKEYADKIRELRRAFVDGQYFVKIIEALQNDNQIPSGAFSDSPEATVQLAHTYENADKTERVVAHQIDNVILGVDPLAFATEERPAGDGPFAAIAFTDTPMVCVTQAWVDENKPESGGYLTLKRDPDGNAILSSYTAQAFLERYAPVVKSTQTEGIGLSIPK